MPSAVLAPAKVNLFLHVVGRRDDGYHLLQSLIFFTDIGDRIILKKAAVNSLTAEGPFAKELPSPSANLAWRAIELLQNYYPELPPFHIHLHKNLPIAAGVGGGSIDAAAVVREAIRMANLRVESANIQKMLQELGAEMPVCYAMQPALVEGIGERIHLYPPLPEWGILLVNPNVSLPTAAVFAALDKKDYLPLCEVTLPESEQQWIDLAWKGQNNLTDAAMQLVPQIKPVLNAISNAEGCFLARMSGSGATCFGLFRNRQEAQEAADKLSESHSYWWIRAGGIFHGA